MTTSSRLRRHAYDIELRHAATLDTLLHAFHFATANYFSPRRMARCTRSRRRPRRAFGAGTSFYARAFSAQHVRLLRRAAAIGYFWPPARKACHVLGHIYIGFLSKVSAEAAARGQCLRVAADDFSWLHFAGKAAQAARYRFKAGCHDEMLPCTPARKAGQRSYAATAIFCHDCRMAIFSRAADTATAR